MRRRLREDLTIDYWPSFVDALLSSVLVLTFVLTVFVITQTSLLERLGSRETALASLSKRLDDLAAQLQLSRAQTLELSGELTRTREDLRRMAGRAELSASQLAQTTATLAATRDRLAAEEQASRRLREEVAARASDITRLTQAIEEYLKKIETLTQQLAAARKDAESKDASLSQLNLSVETLTQQIADLNAKLGEARAQTASSQLEITKLMDIIQQRDSEIARLRDFEKYKSEFLARLTSVFAGQQNIRVVGDRFVFQCEVLFASGSADLTDGGKNDLRKFAETYKALEARIPKTINLNIQVQGHTDTDPIATARFPDNWELSLARAMKVVRYLTLLGIPENRLSAAGYSQYHPVVPDDTVEAKRQNRRIEILITHR